MPPIARPSFREEKRALVAKWKFMVACTLRLEDLVMHLLTVLHVLPAIADDCLASLRQACMSHCPTSA